MQIELSTPALLFPAVSLLFLSYTNRFLALSALIRKLHTEWREDSKFGGKSALAQIENLRHRLVLIRWMQVSGAVSLFCCVLSMAAMLLDFRVLGVWIFGTALFLMAVSLIALVKEASVSGGALNILLNEAEEKEE
ncbi:Protein of unknown function [Rubritalea squalenifaciens DSM 18772]|uniref:II family cellulose-binding protein n=2 Tax=Rubritalea TaxID=361050 RepID=A0A1M6NN88_9BACT|nr:DUF2721 domain-containing protein [Rubritalea squalenifaciens]SHJ97190.1 Protein of unknown function [Rubritalea squalenifaciens DSM 18772]